jgi:energy-coupling factor transporter ATP-binding protein EcfA2
MPLTLAGVAPQERAARVAQALAGVGLEDRAGHRPDQLSGGQRQRVAIARAAILRPGVLLADEPTGNLDSVSGRAIMQLLESLNGEGTTLIVITHDAALGGRARRQIRLADGVIVSDNGGRSSASESCRGEPVRPSDAAGLRANEFAPTTSDAAGLRANEFAPTTSDAAGSGRTSSPLHTDARG